MYKYLWQSQNKSVLNWTFCELSCVYVGDVKRDVARDIPGDIAPYLLTLANRNNPICVAPPKVAKASNEGDIATQYRGYFCMQISTM